MIKKKSRFSKTYMFTVLLIMYIPIIVVIIYSFNPSKINSIWEGFSLKWYAELFRDKGIMTLLKNSLLLGATSSLNAAVIGTLGAIGMSKLNFHGKPALDYIATIPIMAPEIILGISYLAFFAFLTIPFGFLTLNISHTAFCIPYVYMMVKARLVGLDETYVEAARDLGASRSRAFFDITLPAIIPAIFSGVALAFAMSMDDVVISIFATGSKFSILPVKLYTQTKTTVSPKYYALYSLMLLATIILIIIANFLGKYNKTNSFSKEENK